MKRWLLLVFIVLVNVSFVSAIFVGLVDGFIEDQNNNIVSGANVVASVPGCSGGGCTGSSVSDGNGYYVIPNLNIPKNGPVSVSATSSGSGSGSATGTADSFQIAHVNVTLCESPSDPVQVPVPDGHSNFITFSYSAGIDPNGEPTFSEFRLDGAVTSPAPLTITQNVSFGSHTWDVRTCNDDCCSNWVSDNFNVGNLAPSAPTNIGNSTGGGTTALSWTSGIDPENDPVFDEFDYNGVVTSPVASPVIVANEVLIQWRVRTCDNLGACSAWVSENTVTCSQIDIAECTAEASARIRGRTATVTEPDVEVLCNGQKILDDSVRQVEIILGEETRVSLKGKDFALSEVKEFCPWCYDRQQNYDEDAIDCGGDSCAPCKEGAAGVVDQFLKRYPVTLIVTLVLLGIAIVAYVARRFGWLRK